MFYEHGGESFVTRIAKLFGILFQAAMYDVCGEKRTVVVLKIKHEQQDSLENCFNQLCILGSMLQFLVL